MSARNSSLALPPESVPTQPTMADVLADVYSPVADALDRSELVFAQQLASKSAYISALVDRVRAYRGKRLRPALLLLVAEALGGTRREHEILAAVVEMIHTATLVHDDVLDQSPMRRFVPTVNAEWGLEASLLLGDYLLTHAFFLATQAGSIDACRLLGQATNQVCEGELHQVGQQGVFELTEEEYYAIIRGKTAALFACSTELGCAFHDSPPALVKAMRCLGESLGVAFQLIDDLLDLVGDDKQIGKPTGADLEMQKATLPLIRFQAVAAPAALHRCRHLFNEPTSNARQELLALLAETDAIDYARDAARRAVSHAQEQVGRLPESAARDSLFTITRMMLDRSA